MSCSLRSTFLLMVTLFAAHNYAAILPEYNNTMTSFNLSKNAHCYDDDHTRYHPITMDCLQAQQLIPTGGDLGMFHRAGPDDEFRLPVIVSTRTCTIVIDLKTNLPQLATWRAVSFATRALIQICSKGSAPGAKTGGVGHVGQSHRIRISLLKIPPGGPGFDNITESASTS